jgi:hypothetical protein
LPVHFAPAVGIKPDSVKPVHLLWLNSQERPWLDCTAMCGVVFTAATTE